MMLIIDEDELIAGIGIAKADAAGTWPIGDAPDGAVLGKLSI
jgi:hypothetical protein